jgi:hypothetical protein
MLAEPQEPWRILTSGLHSTVWDGERTLFEFNYQAFKIYPAQCFSNARWEQLAPGQLLVHQNAIKAKPKHSTKRDGSGAGKRLKPPEPAAA